MVTFKAARELHLANSGMRKKQIEAQDSIISYTQKRVNEPEQEKLDKIREL
jgi:hypothetical protein